MYNIIMKKYKNSNKCYNLKHKYYKKYKKIIFNNNYIKINNPRNEFTITQKLFIKKHKNYYIL
uniref:Ribosomal protein S17 n=1 Tax=Babesia duncani TaxID=323732 RepID=A0A385GNI9_9APIC|nr:ribosomal protein S17 [Babesia duncani]